MKDSWRSCYTGIERSTGLLIENFLVLPLDWKQFSGDFKRKFLVTKCFVSD